MVAVIEHSKHQRWLCLPARLQPSYSKTGCSEAYELTCQRGEIEL